MNDPRRIALRACAAVEPGWLALRGALWPEVGEDAHRAEAEAVVAAPERHCAVVAEADGRVVGFAEASLRREHVNGTHGSPVGFIEGLYVNAELRGRGLARRLVGAIEEWARARGCRELASDTLIDNAAGILAHRALGFEETERVVFFRKQLGG